METLTTHSYEYPRPAVTVDAVVFGFRNSPAEKDENLLSVLLVRRGGEPFKGRWALPGGFVGVRDDGDQGEDLESAVRRELKEETAVEISYLEQLYTFGAPGRDPRGRVIDVAYFALVRSADHRPTGGDDAAEAAWFSMSSELVTDALRGRGPDGRSLAFDHDRIVKMALERLQAKVRYAPVGFNLLPPEFTLSELQKLYEAILQRPVDKRNFRRSILRMGLLADTGTRTGERHRPAVLYRFDKASYDRAVREGFNFEL